MRPRPRCLLPVLLAALASGCVPYPVGYTAQPAAVGDWEPAQMVYFIPNGIRPAERDDEDPWSAGEGASFVGFDGEVRTGIDEASDVGIRTPGGVGAVVTYKRRVAGSAGGPALALMGGGGFLNLFNHAHLEATAIASGRESGVVVPYGGLRAMQAIPLSDIAPSDAPTLGGFAGLLIGPRDARRLGGPRVGLEVGVFYDPSALDLRQNDWIVVPSLTVHGALPLLGGGRFPF